MYIYIYIIFTGKFVYIYIYIYIYINIYIYSLGFTPSKAVQPLQGMEFKRLKHARNLSLEGTYS